MALVNISVFVALKAHESLERIYESNKHKIPFQIHIPIKKLMRDLDCIGETVADVIENADEGYTDEILDCIIELEDYDLTLTKLLSHNDMSVGMNDLQLVSFLLRPS